MAIRPPGPRGAARPAAAALPRALGAPTLSLLALGAMMGSGLFVASGLVIRAAGAAALGLYAVGWAAMALEIGALAEMAAANPVPGSFLVYAREVLGPGWSFVSGWVYWLSSVLTMSSEVTAAALLSRGWAPGLPLWVWSLGYSAAVIAANFASVRGFGALEGVMAALKIGAVLAFLVVGATALAGRGAHLAALTGGQGLLPHGLPGAASGLLLALFAYAGTGVLGMAAAETRRPATAIPRAAGATVALAGLLYLGSVLLLLALVPWSRMPETSSPFVAALAAAGRPLWAGAMNAVLLTAVLSTMNAALYANVRALFGLAEQRQAPARLGRLDRRGIPAAATWVSAAALGATILLAYLLPQRAYADLVTATGFQAMFIWLMILVTHLRYRPLLARTRPGAPRFRLFGFPLTTLAVIAVVLAALAGSWSVPAERVGAAVGLGGIALAALVWLAARGNLLAHLRR